MLKIWGRESSSNVQKVLWACAELAIPYERIDVGGPFGGLDTAAYRSLNPNGLIPTVEEDDFVLWESHAILRYLAGGDAQHRLLPTGLTRRDRASIDQWMDWAMVALGLTLRNLFVLISKSAPRPAAPEELAAANAAAGRLFTILDSHLQRARYVGGSEFTLADIPCGISAHRWLGMPVTRPALPALDAWYASISARPAFQVIRGPRPHV